MESNGDDDPHQAGADDKNNVSATNPNPNSSTTTTTTPLEVEEERLREKLKKRRRTDDQGPPSAPPPSLPKDPPLVVVAANAAGDTPATETPSQVQPRRSPPSASSRSQDRHRRMSTSQDRRSLGGGEPFPPEDHRNRYSPPHRHHHHHRHHSPSRHPSSHHHLQQHYPPHHHRRGEGPPSSGRWERGGPPGYYPYQDGQRGGGGGGPPYRGGGRGVAGPPFRDSGRDGEYEDRGHGYRPTLDDRRGGDHSRSRSHSTHSGGTMTSESRSRSRSRSNGRHRNGGLVGERHPKRTDEDGGPDSTFRPRNRRDGGGSRSSKSSSHRSRHSRSRSTSSSSSSSSASSSSSSSSSSIDDENALEEVDSPFSKDQRTVFVAQLVMRTQEKDIRRYFRKKVGCLVKEVILLRDKRTGNHKGCAYVQFGRIEDVNKAVSVSGQPPDFQRFPILVKPSEAEKNYVLATSSSVVTASMMGISSAASSAASAKPLMSANGKLIEAQKVYIGSLDPSVTDEHIFALFSQFGQLEKVTLQMDPTTKTSRGFAFLSYRHPEEANLAIQTMSNQLLAGRAIKTGWASQTSTIQGVEMVTSEDFPPDAADRARKAMMVLAKMSGVSDAAMANAAISATAERALEVALAGTTTTTTPGVLPTVADARAHLVAASTGGANPAVSPPAVKLIGGEEHPTKNVLVHNMFDKDQESGDDWPMEIKEDFEEECSKFGTITSIKVMSMEPGGKIYASFETVEAATQCANNLAGRWFDKRQLRVDFMTDDQMPQTIE